MCAPPFPLAVVSVAAAVGVPHRPAVGTGPVMARHAVEAQRRIRKRSERGARSPARSRSV
jgi:hypothetical protein